MLCNLLLALAAGAAASHAARLEVQPEYVRTGPDGDILAPDRGAAPARLPFRGARAGYTSFQVIVRLDRPGPYSLTLDRSTLQIDVFREWYHKLQRNEGYFPDALIPVSLPYRSRLPEPDALIPDQTAQAFWLDVWAGPSGQPGKHPVTLRLESAEGNAQTTVPVEILSARVPGDDVVTIDHNSYGTSWLADQYPKLRAATSGDFFKSDALFKLIHAYHRIFYEHRGTFHQLGYGHAGKTGPEFAPALEGEGRRKHITSWDLYDRHYGPLFDGSAFAGTRRGPRPIPFAYLPINPEWPASYLWWGEPGYEVEFVNVVSEMERHFSERGWTRTRLEMFFNHKKRYMGYSWDGDEVRFPADNAYFTEYARLLKKAVPADSPVRFVFRSDVSWDMERQSKHLAGAVNMWVSSGGILSWYPNVARALKARNEIVWFYSGPPPVSEPSAKITEFPLQAWLWGIDGYIHWLVVGSGADPWNNFDGGGTALVYPGERFGVEGPIPGIRLKIQRNAIQDLALLGAGQRARAEAARRFNASTPEDWWNPLPALAAKPPYEWSGEDIEAATRKTTEMLRKTRSDSWENVHRYVMEVAAEGK